MFDEFVQASQAQDEAAMRKLAGRTSMAWANNVLMHALGADAAQIASLGSWDQLQVLSLRVEHPVAELENLRPLDLLGSNVAPELKGQYELRVTGINETAATAGISSPSLGLIAEGVLFTKANGRWHIEWHQVPKQIWDRIVPKPTDAPTFYREHFKSLNQPWDDRLLEAPR